MLGRSTLITARAAGRTLQKRTMAGNTWEYAVKNGHHPVRWRTLRRPAAPPPPSPSLRKRWRLTTSRGLPPVPPPLLPL
jgi:hypothetical protein